MNPTPMPAHGPLPSNPRKRPRALLQDLQVADHDHTTATSTSYAGSALGRVFAPFKRVTHFVSNCVNPLLSFLGAEPVAATTPPTMHTITSSSTAAGHSSAADASSTFRHSSPLSVSVSRTSQPPTGHTMFRARDLYATSRGFLVPDTSTGDTQRQPSEREDGAALASSSSVHQRSHHNEHQLYPSIYAATTLILHVIRTVFHFGIIIGHPPISTSWAVNLPTSSSFSFSDTSGTNVRDHRQSRRTTSSVPDSRVTQLASSSSSLMPPPLYSRRSDNPKLNVNEAIQRARQVMSPIPSSLASGASSSSSHAQPTSIIDLTLASSTTSTSSSRPHSRASHARSSHSSTTASSSRARSWRSTPSDPALTKLCLSSKFQPLTAEDVNLMYRLRHLRGTVHSPVTHTPESEIYARLRAQDDEVDRKVSELAAQAALASAPKRSVDLWDLTPEMEQKVADSLEFALDPANEAVPMVDHINNALIGKDFATLKPKTWLNDEIVNTYGIMLAKRAAESASFFYSRFRDEGYARIKSWTRGKKMLLGKTDLLVFPIHGGAHWTVGCVNFKRKRIEYYDSLHGPDGGFFKRMRMYLSEEARDKLNEEFDFEGKRSAAAQLVRLRRVYVRVYGYITREEELTDAFDQTHLVKWRKRVYYELLTKQMLT
ncbi:hypothetical protein BCR44DRAFT_1499587 [Catenaria anguillulae PL171]|uniref:Ubiquitin-like protease family profile domain-containing protein n=1 Tax=Catenaria anguillulae PL171 TaxID=765915 RepID=A0A1Y2HLC4_9FUNG|nr:hypothetical protein BCR44DRAFT_1499587 [Catenaria anguillulae PL171]